MKTVMIPISQRHFAEFLRRKGPDVDVGGIVDNVVLGYLESTAGDLDLWDYPPYQEWLENADPEELDDDYHYQLARDLHAEEKKREFGDPQKGLLWGPLFLSNGTELRMKYHGEFHFAFVAHEKLRQRVSLFDFDPENPAPPPIFESPSELARVIARGTNRNAWRDFSIHFPTDKPGKWTLADVLRRQKRSQP